MLTREAGVLIVIKLMQVVAPDWKTAHEVSYFDIGGRFGVSRTRVRKLLETEKNARAFGGK